MEEDSYDLFRRDSSSQQLSEEVINAVDSPQRIAVRNESLAHELNNLNRAKERFKVFLEELNELKRTPIREDIINYCGEQRRSYKVIENYSRPESLIKKMDVRIDKMVKTRRIKRNWGQEDLKILVWIISKYCDLHHYADLEKDIDEQDWAAIASYIPGVTPEACMFKWLSIRKITLSTFKWLDPESELLEKIVFERMSQSREGVIRDWKDISQELYTLNEDDRKVYRNAKQCKQHWNCHLNPELRRGLWQPDEDIKLLKFIRDNKGNKKWSELSKHFEGRTENALKNRHKLIVQKLQKQVKNKHKDELLLISEYLQKLMVDQFTSGHPVNEEIFDSNSEIKVEYEEEMEVDNSQKPREFWQETNDNVVVTPIRVEKFNFSNLKNMDSHFLRSIQPGTICGDGTFRKMTDNASEGKSDDDEPLEFKPRGPFALVPLVSTGLLPTLPPRV